MNAIYSLDVVRFAREMLGLKLDAKQTELLALATTPDGKR